MTNASAPRGTTGYVVVFYRPDADCVVRANRLCEFGPCVVVDNTERAVSAASLGLDPSAIYIANGENRGVGEAFNQGVERLIELGCEFAMLFDQDSEPESELLRGLPEVLARELSSGTRVALAGPAYDDRRLGGVVPFVRFGYFKLKRVPPTGTRPVDVDFLISSGSCLNLAAWREVGPMDEGLFIDFVDLEWCIRARAKGYAVLGVPAFRLSHELGGEPVRVFGRKYPGHNALRHYYMFRNAIALFKRRYVPLTWKSTEFVKLPVRLAIYAIFMTPRLDHLRMSLLGLWHGAIGRTGAR
ncbi:MULTISPECIES: glycosyltransferase family 2 protein [unclassified Burkholderia]|uniref:glycosyltransferase family 2 protein n=1 Tax=unclassified Burkholderia TaxID=2613784 RepID=UPI0005CEB1F3|nr:MULTISPECIES: glycosyltransferase family 2 protein [unclassified Burkholderia]TGN94607.1 glycosyltransferase family 2 protein [Burkholderia sp. USMB20]